MDKFKRWWNSLTYEPTTSDEFRKWDKDHEIGVPSFSGFFFVSCFSIALMESGMGDSWSYFFFEFFPNAIATAFLYFGLYGVVTTLLHFTCPYKSPLFRGAVVLSVWVFFAIIMFAFSHAVYG